MNISMLKRYSELKSEIDALGKQIEGLYNTYRSPCFETIGSPRRSARASPVEKTVNHITALQKNFTEEYLELIETGRDIETWLQAIDDPETVAIIRCRYLLGMTWRETTRQAMGKNYSWSASKTKLRRFLDGENNAPA